MQACLCVCHLVEVCLYSSLRPQTQSRTKRGETGGGVSRMLLGLLLPPRAEGRQALGTQCRISGPLLLGAMVGILLAPCWEEPPTSSPQGQRALGELSLGGRRLAVGQRWTVKMAPVLLQTPRITAADRRRE